MQIDIEQIKVVHLVGNAIWQGNASHCRGIIWLGILLIVRSVRTTESRSRADLVADQPQNMPIPCHQGPQGMGCILFRALTAK